MKNLTRTMLVWAVLAGLVISFCKTPTYAEEGSEVEKLIKSLELGKSFNYRNLTIVPIYSTKIDIGIDYATLDEAAKNGYIQIMEVEGGRVPQVKVTNKSGRYIYMMAGEILTGAKQNRLVGKDVLLGPYNKEVIVPVYCVEQGRWSGKSYDFKSEAIAAAPAFRYKAARGASQSMIWEGVAEYSAKLDVHSETGDLTAAYSDSKVSEEADHYVAALQEVIPRLEEDAVGVAVAVGNKIITIDIFENPQLFSKLWPKLLRSYAMEAIATDFNDENADITQEHVKNILNILYQKRYDRRDGIALGTDLSATAGEVTSTGLAYKGRVVHLSAFPNDGARQPVIDKGERTPVIQVE